MQKKKNKSNKLNQNLAQPKFSGEKFKNITSKKKKKKK